MTKRIPKRNTTPDAPAPPPPIDDLPHALTFFLSHRDRRLVIAKLRTLHNNRAQALRIALGLHTEAGG